MRKPNKKQIYLRTEAPRGSMYYDYLVKTYGTGKADRILKNLKIKNAGMASESFLKKIRAYKSTQEFN